MAAGGPVAAIDVCANSAPAIASALSVDGLTVGRTSSRLRNSKNTAPTWLNAQMTTWQQQQPAERTPVFFEAADHDPPTRFAAPLSMQPLCATCHGETVADDVKAAITARYPNDQATGFAANDLRGAVWVELSR
jgi:hypothetical protein